MTIRDRWFSKVVKRSSKVDPDRLERNAEESINRTKKNQPLVDNLTSFLKARELKNGFGEDFEITLVPKEAK
jgi:hypothetical protein